MDSEKSFSFFYGNNIGAYPNTSCHAEQSEASRAGTLQETLRDPSYRQDDNIAIFSMPWVNSYIVAKKIAAQRTAPLYIIRSIDYLIPSFLRISLGIAFL